MILLKIAHERNDKAERLAELEYFKEKEQRSTPPHPRPRQEREAHDVFDVPTTKRQRAQAQGGASWHAGATPPTRWAAYAC